MFTEINIELTNRCNKNCWICNRWQDKHEKGDMPKYILELISRQMPKNTIIHFHNNGEPLLYPDIKYATELFNKAGCITQFDTNGKLLMERKDEIKDVAIISVSIIEQDEFFTSAEQLKILHEYLMYKPKNQVVIARCVGTIDDTRKNLLELYGTPIVNRMLHNKLGRFDYEKDIIKPEDYICRDFMNHPAIDFMGNFYICVKYDPEQKGRLGNVASTSIKGMWEGEKRKEWLKAHICNHRDLVEPCKDCSYYGYPNDNNGGNKND